MRSPEAKSIANVRVKLDHAAIYESFTALRWNEYLTMVDANKAAGYLVETIQSVIKTSSKTVTYISM